MSRRRLHLLPMALSCVLLTGVLCLSGCGGGKTQPEDDGATDGEAATTEAAAPDEGSTAGDESDEGEEETADSSLTPLPRRNVEVYFPSLVEPGLVAEYREIFATATPGDQIKQILADLISGPTGDSAGRALPGGTRLRQAFVLDDGVAWLDFSSELTEGMPGGSEVELMTIYAIVNSVAANVTQVRRVGILINGAQVETLNGHVHLLNPLPPDFSLVLGSVTVSGPEDSPADASPPVKLASAKAD